MAVRAPGDSTTPTSDARDTSNEEDGDASNAWVSGAPGAAGVPVTSGTGRRRAPCGRGRCAGRAVAGRVVAVVATARADMVSSCEGRRAPGLGVASNNTFPI